MHVRRKWQQIPEFAERGRLLQKQKSQAYWHDIEIQLSQATREKITATEQRLQGLVDRGHVKEHSAVNYVHDLYRIALIVQQQGGIFENPRAVDLVLAQPQWKGQVKFIQAAYNHFREANNIRAKLTVKRDRRRQLPILTPENTLQQSLGLLKTLRWTTYFRLRYETGPRPQEPFWLEKQDVNFDRQLVRYKTAKGSGDTIERELPISPLCTEQLRTLIADKAATDYVFTKPLVPDKPLDYKDAEEVMRRTRGQLQHAGYNVQGLNLYVYRHAFATRLYHATKELALVQRALGHRNIEDTMIYIHLHPDQPRRYDVVNLPLSDKPAINLKIAEGWELALQTLEEVWYRRPRWVP